MHEMLTPEQHDEYFRRGYTCIRGAFSPDDAVLMVDRFWSYVEEKLSIVRRDQSTWTEGIVTGIADLKLASEFQKIGSDAVTQSISELLESDDWKRPRTWGQILATFPSRDGDWNWDSLLQRKMIATQIQWHTDYPFEASPSALAGVQVFAILSDLDTGGGGTLVIDGSPKLVEQFVRSRDSQSLANMKKTRTALMASNDWFVEVSKAVSLPQPDEWMVSFDETIDGVPVSVRDLTGQGGDVFLCHPWLLHASSPNCQSTPRLMCTQRIYRSKT